jgi:CheY-like chemotaxis protein
MGDEDAGRVLAVDDRAEFTELLATDLEAQGYVVETALSGEECLAKATEFQPEVILLDVQMPGMDGFTTCFRLKEDPRLRDIPVIFLTGHNAEEGSAVAAIAAGGADFLEKPYSPIILFSRVAAQLTAFRRLHGYVSAALRDPASGCYTRAALVDAAVREVARLRRDGGGALAVAWIEPTDLPPASEPAARRTALDEAVTAWSAALPAPDMVAIDDGGALALFVGSDVEQAKQRSASATEARAAARSGVAGGDVPAEGDALELVERWLQAAREAG